MDALFLAAFFASVFIFTLILSAIVDWALFRLLGVTHGDGAKMEELPQIMAHLRPQEWGNSTQRRWITGHIHHKTVKEFNGCTVESMNTLAPSDAWHSKSGYFAAREMQCMIFHEEHGLVARNICPVGLAHS